MTWTVLDFESTPNPNAMKCWVDRPISEGPRSFRSLSEAQTHTVARRLFEEAGATSVLLCGSWLTVNKKPSQRWPRVQQSIEHVLRTCDAGDADA